ncbi:XrtA/PEP-CTERM system TPR-repeat protein PrsT [Methylotuvimicrobium sp.]|uniref:XrtA/PEP-CTERM system TPR-repeat protein PrsT n=1 Tax=Methylotuvimicrobium sp. TaxID=2822413 RepID=UPI003D64B6E5
MNTLSNLFIRTCRLTAIMMKKFASSLIVLPVLLYSAGALAISDQAGQDYEKAVVAYRNGEVKTAIIHLKNALQHHPDYVSAHILLGEAYLREKDLAGAEVALSRAMKLGADKSLLVRHLAQLYLYQIKYSQLINEIDPEHYSQSVQSELYVFRGDAYLQLGLIDNAIEEYNTAARKNPASVAPSIGRANALLRKNDFQEASLFADQATLMEPGNAGTWYIKASIKHAKGELNAAVADYDKALSIDPEHLDARLARIGIFMDQKKDGQAESDLLFVRKTYPFEPKAAYLLSVVLARNGKVDEAAKSLEEADDILSQIKQEFLLQHSQSLLLSALVNYSLNRFEQASVFAKNYIDRFPDHPGVYKLLGTMLLSKNAPDKVIELLNPVIPHAHKDFRLSLILAEAYMKLGRYDKATEMLNLASENTSHVEGGRTDLGLAWLALGQENQGIEELERDFAANPVSGTAGLPLLILYVKRGETGKGMALARQLHLKEPENLTILNMLGIVQAAAGQLTEARNSFEKAAEINSQFLPAQFNLGKLDSAEKKFDKAERRLSELHSKYPQNQAVMIELARVLGNTSNYDEAERVLTEAKKINAKSVPVFLAQIDLKLKQQKYSEAVQVARGALALAPEDAGILGALGQAYLSSGNNKQAAVIFERMARNAGFHAERLYDIANLQIAAEDYLNAIESLKNAVLSDEAHVPSRIRLAELQLNYGNPLLALNLAQELVEKYPEKAHGYRLMGDIQRREQNYTGALQHYRTAFGKEKNIDHLMKLYFAYKQAGQNNDAFELLKSWTGDRPDDHAAIAALAEEFLHRNKWHEAQQHFERLSTIYPNDASLMNNLAYIYFQQNDSNALRVAERARELAPELASVNDTLGWILVHEGQIEKGLNYLRNAHSRASEDPEIRYHIGVALYRLGRLDEAKAEFEAAINTGQTFNGIEDAKALRDKIGR